MLQKTHQKINIYSSSDREFFSNITDIENKGLFTYQYFKKLSLIEKSFLYRLNYLYQTEKDLLNYPFSEDLEKKIAVFSNILLRELIYDIKSNYKLIKEIYIVSGSPILYEILDYVVENEIISLKFSDYQLYNTPESAICHLIIYTKPLKEENKELVIKHLKQNYDYNVLLYLSVFCYHWREFFEQALEIEGLVEFYETVYAVNGNIIEQNYFHEDKRRANILKISAESSFDGIVNLNKLKKALNNINIDIIKKILDIMEFQKFASYDLLIFIKAALGLNHEEVIESFEKREAIGIRAYGILETEISKEEKYLNIQNLKEKIKRKAFSEDYYLLTSLDVALKNISQLVSYEEQLFYLIRMENELALDQDQIELFNFYQKDNYSQNIEQIDISKTDKSYRNIDDAIKIKKANLENHKLQYNRLLSFFEKLLIEQIPLNKDMLTACLENDLSRKILNNIIFINDKMQCGYLKWSLMVLRDPINEMDYPIDSQIRIAHPITISKSGLLDQYEDIVINKKIKQDIPQIFRGIFVYNENIKKNLDVQLRKKLPAAPLINCLIKKSWYITKGKYLYKTFENQSIKIRLNFYFDESDNSYLWLEDLQWFNQEYNLILDEDSIDPIIISEIFYDLNEALQNIDKAFIGIDRGRIKLNYLTKWIKLNGLDERITVNESRLELNYSLDYIFLDPFKNKIYYVDFEGKSIELVPEKRIKRFKKDLYNLPFLDSILKIYQLLEFEKFKLN